MYDFKFTDIGEGLHEGKILKWNFKVGDKVKEGDTLVVVETDKVNAELPSPVDGIITKLGKEEGEIIHVGETVVLIDDGKGEAPKVSSEPISEKKSEGGASVIGSIEVSSDIITSSNESVSSTSGSNKKALATPVARKLAKDLGLDINQIIGSGENGRVMKEDILAKAHPSSVTSVSAPINVEVKANGDVSYLSLSKLRQSIVKAMTISKQVIPHTVLMDEIEIDKLVSLRNQAKVQAEKQGIKLTYMAFIIKAITIALKEFPLFNSSFDHNNGQIILKHYMNIGIAVDTPDGLIVPNLKNADQKSIFSLAKELKEVGDLTKQRKVQLAQLQNTTFTITNFGAADIAFGTPIINHPEVAILGIGKIVQKPIVENNAIRIGYVLPLSIAVDHRIIDGADAGRFLFKVKELLHEPTLLLMD